MKLQLKHPQFERIATLETAMPVILILWGTWFAMFDIVKTQNFAESDFLSSRAWAVIFCTVGFLKAGAIIFEYLKFRRVLVIAAFSLWTAMLVLTARSNFASLAVPSCWFFMYLCVLLWQRLTNLIEIEKRQIEKHGKTENG